MRSEQNYVYKIEEIFHFREPFLTQTHLNTME